MPASKGYTVRGLQQPAKECAPFNLPPPQEWPLLLWPRGPLQQWKACGRDPVRGCCDPWAARLRGQGLWGLGAGGRVGMLRGRHYKGEGRGRKGRAGHNVPCDVQEISSGSARLLALSSLATASLPVSRLICTVRTPMLFQTSKHPLPPLCLDGTRTFRPPALLLAAPAPASPAPSRSRSPPASGRMYSPFSARATDRSSSVFCPSRSRMRTASASFSGAMGAGPGGLQHQALRDLGVRGWGL